VAVRSDAPVRLVDVLSGREATGPIWRGSSDQPAQRAVVAVVAGLQLEKELARTLRERRIVADVVPVTDTAAGLQALSSGSAQAFFGDRLVLLAAVAKAGPSSHVMVLDRLFRRDMVALALRRDDDAFRLVVDRALSRLYRGGELAPLMCVDKALGEVESFDALAAEAAQAGPPWAIVFSAALAGRNGRVPGGDEARALLQTMVDSVKSGRLDGMLAFNRHGVPVRMG